MGLRIDRSSFLSLAFGMSGAASCSAACNPGPPAVSANMVEIPAQPPQPADAGASNAVAAAKGDEPKLRATPPKPEVDDDDDDDDMGLSVDEGGGVAGGVAAATCGFVDPKKVTRPAAACNEDQGVAPSCAVMKSCPQGFPFPRQHCESYRASMKPKVAQKALDCLAKLSAKDVCDACTTYRCGELALKGACPDPGADASCNQITAKCKSVSMADCRLYLSGMNTTGRAKMVSCLTNKSGCGFGLFSCAESL